MYKLIIKGTPMRTVTASEAKQGFASVLQSCEHEPVVIQKQKRDVAVVMSMQEYGRLTRLNVAEFQRFCDAAGEAAAQRGLTEETLDALLRND
jgi:PHD/YefM family antitoxin component YafN of YafNO toxin-antitoxin module